MKIMRNSVLITSTALLACTLALPLGAKDKKQVTRAIKGSSVMTIHYTLTSPTTANFHNEEVGEATYTGRFHNVSEGTTSFLTGPLTASGTITAANGDTAHWVLDNGNWIIEGGTGRFENASGYLLWTVVSQSDPVPDSDGAGFTVIILAEYGGEITF